MNARKHMKHNRFNKKLVVLLAALALTACVTIGTTVAFLLDSTEPVENIFQPTEVTCDIEETFKDNVKENVAVKNTGDVDAYIRVAIVVTWKDKDSNVYAGTPKAEEDYAIDLDEEEWIQKGGYYYYTKPVAAKKSTSVLIKECKPIEDRTPDGYGLNVEILAEAIQSKPAKAVQESWNVTVNADGTLSTSGGGAEK